MSQKHTSFHWHHAHSFSIAISLFLIALCIGFLLWNYSPFIPVPFLSLIKLSPQKALPLHTFLIQTCAGALFFLYGSGAWALVASFMIGSWAVFQIRSYSLLIRTIGTVCLVPLASTLAHVYRMNVVPFSPGGTIGTSLARIFYFYVPQPYQFISGSICSLLIVAMIAQEKGILCLKYANNKLKIIDKIHSIGSILAAWFLYFFPFFKYIIPRSSYDDHISINSLIEQAITEDYQTVFSLCTQKDEQFETIVLEKKNCSLSDLLYDEKKSYISPSYDHSSHQMQELTLALKNLDINAQCVSVQAGPRVTTFLLSIAPGMRVHQLLTREDDIAYALGKQNIRIHIPVHGSRNIGIEIENDKKYIVSLNALLHAPEFNSKTMQLPLLLGTETTGKPYVSDLAAMPHLLIAGTTGSGKSVTVHSIIISLLWHFNSDELKFILIDPKRLECSIYKSIPHLLCPVLYEPQEIMDALDVCIEEMNKRYAVLSLNNVRSLHELHLKNSEFKNQYPYYVVIVDEYADLHMNAGEQCEKKIVRLCQMARASGIHVILATQRPSVDVISGVVKANIPSRIACRVSSKIDSKVIIDTCGAEKLLGKGDMLFLDSMGTLQRVHGGFIAIHEIEYFISCICCSKTIDHDTLKENRFTSDSPATTTNI